jgi:hypothetical protein
MDHVARLLDGVPQLGTRRRGRYDGNVKTFEEMLVAKVLLKVTGLVPKRA